MQPSTFTVNVTGKLFDFYEQSLKKQEVNVYDFNNNHLNKITTSPTGRFNVEINCQKRDTINLIFRYTLATRTRSLAESVVGFVTGFFNANDETQEIRCSFKASRSKIDLENLNIRDKKNEETPPGSYLGDVVGAVAKAEKNLITAKAATLLSHGEEAPWSDTISALQSNLGITPIPLTNQSVWESLTEGIRASCNFRKQGKELTVQFVWPYERDKLMSLPEVKAVFIENSPCPQIKKIKVKFSDTLDPAKINEMMGPSTTYKPERAHFEEGLRILNSAILLEGQIKDHLTFGHLYGAQIAQKAIDNLIGSTFGDKLILPFCSLIRFISYQAGDPQIFGKSGILNRSGLSQEGIWQKCYDTLGGIDFATFEPRTPINEKHKFAHAQKIYFEMLKNKIALFVDDNWKTISKSDWPAIHKFFKELHKNSADFCPAVEGQAKDGSYLDSSEIEGVDNPNAPARTKCMESDEKVRSLRPVATNPSGPNKTDKEMLIRFATHFIHFVTFRHTMAHHSQFEGTHAPHGMDLNFSPITLENYGKGPQGGISYNDAMDQLRLAEVFKNFPEENYSLLRSKSVPEEIIEGLKEISEDMLKYDVDISKIMVTTVI